MSAWLNIRARRVRMARYSLYLMAVLSVLINVIDTLVGMAGDYRLELLILPILAAVLYLTRYHPLRSLPSLVAVAIILVHLLVYLVASPMTTLTLMLFISAPLLFFFLSNIYIGGFFAVAVLVFFVTLTGNSGLWHEHSAELIQAIVIYTVLVLTAALYERDWLTVESRLQLSTELDFLTQVYNRQGLMRMLHRSMANALRHRRTLAVVLFQVKEYESLQERFGRHRGEHMLLEMTRLLNRHIRAGDCLGRWGDHSFMILAPDTDVSGASRFADKLRRLLHSYYFEEIGHIRVDIGVVTPGNDSMESMLEKAQRAVDMAANQGDIHVIEP